jgi:hypothetical protein
MLQVLLNLLAEDKKSMYLIPKDNTLNLAKPHLNTQMVNMTVNTHFPVKWKINLSDSGPLMVKELVLMFNLTLNHQSKYLTSITEADQILENEIKNSAYTSPMDLYKLSISETPTEFNP